MEEELKELKNKLKIAEETILNLMGCFDTPVARLRINDKFSNLVREEARKALEELGLKHPVIIY